MKWVIFPRMCLLIAPIKTTTNHRPTRTYTSYRTRQRGNDVTQMPSACMAWQVGYLTTDPLTVLLSMSCKAQAKMSITSTPHTLTPSITDFYELNSRHFVAIGRLRPVADWLLYICVIIFPKRVFTPQSFPGTLHFALNSHSKVNEVNDSAAVTIFNWQINIFDDSLSSFAALVNGFTTWHQTLWYGKGIS